MYIVSAILLSVPTTRKLIYPNVIKHNNNTNNNNDHTLDVFDVVMDFVLLHEGTSFVNDKNIDEISRRGITLGAYRQFHGKGDIDDIKMLSENGAVMIYKHMYWSIHNMDSIVQLGYPKTSAVLFDSGINIGTFRANKYLQNILNIRQTGYIDEQTLTALKKNKISDADMSLKLINIRQRFYDRLSLNDKYTRYHLGWSNRLNDIKILVNGII